MYLNYSKITEENDKFILICFTYEEDFLFYWFFKEKIILDKENNLIDIPTDSFRKLCSTKFLKSGKLFYSKLHLFIKYDEDKPLFSQGELDDLIGL